MILPNYLKFVIFALPFVVVPTLIYSQSDVDSVEQVQDHDPESAPTSPIPSPPLEPNEYQDDRLDEQERDILKRHEENARFRRKPEAAEKPKTGKRPAKSTGIEKTPISGKLRLDAVDQPLIDVLRAIGTAYKISIIPDPEVGEKKVTIHLEDVPVMEGLEKLCRYNGLELLQDGNIFRVKKASEKTISEMQMQAKRLNLDVENQPVKEFLRDFVENTKINVIAGSDLSGNVTGHLKNVLPINGLKALMEANGYKIRTRNGIYLVEEEEDPSGTAGGRKFRRPGMSSRGTSLDIDVRDDKVSLSLNNAPLGDAVRELAEQSGLNIIVYGEILGTVNAELRDISLDNAMESMLKGTKYTYIRKNDMLLIGDRSPNSPSGKALSDVDLHFLRFIKVEDIDKIIPKSISTEGIQIIKEQNAILINGTSDRIEEVKAFLEKIDLPVPQVLMEVLVVEYTRQNQSELGVSNGSTESGAEPQSGGNNIIGPGVAADITLDGVRQSIRQGNFTGVIGIKPQNFELRLRALEAKDRARILAMPKITTLNGNKAQLNVQSTSYFTVSSVTKDGLQTLDYRSFDDGITINLTPWVTKHGEVNVDINPVIKTSRPSSADKPPDITTRSITTNVRLLNGETISLGGLIDTKETTVRNFVPILGSIPVLGYLFSWRNKLTRTTEMVIYVTPHILEPVNFGVDLRKELESLDDRAGFLDRMDFLRSFRKQDTTRTIIETPDAEEE